MTYASHPVNRKPKEAEPVETFVDHNEYDKLKDYALLLNSRLMKLEDAAEEAVVKKAQEAALEKVRESLADRAKKTAKKPVKKTPRRKKS